MPGGAGQQQHIFLSWCLGIACSDTRGPCPLAQPTPAPLLTQMQNFSLLTSPKEQQLQAGGRTSYLGRIGGGAGPPPVAPQSPGIPSNPLPCFPPCGGFSSRVPGVWNARDPEPLMFLGWCERLPAPSQLLGRAACGELFPPPAPPSSPSLSTIRTQLSSYQIFRAVKVDKQK